MGNSDNNPSRHKQKLDPFNESSQEYIVNLKLEDLKDIVQKLSFDIPSRLENEHTNYRILAKINSMAILDTVELAPLLDNKMNYTQFKRMEMFLRGFSNKNNEDILKLLKTLCNLPGEMKTTSKDIRQIINDTFPGSVYRRIEDAPPHSNPIIENYQEMNLEKNLNENVSPRETGRSTSLLGLNEQSLCNEKSCNTNKMIPNKIKNNNEGCLVFPAPPNVRPAKPISFTIEMEAESTGLLEDNKYQAGAQQTKYCLDLCKKHWVKGSVVVFGIAAVCLAYISLFTNSDLSAFVSTSHFKPTFPPSGVNITLSNNELLGNETSYKSSFLK